MYGPTCIFLTNLTPSSLQSYDVEIVPNERNLNVCCGGQTLKLNTGSFPPPSRPATALFHRTRHTTAI
jgi:hypothetical protein